MSNTNRAVLYMLFAGLMFAFMGVFAKKLSYEMSSVEIVFFRNIFGVIAVYMSLWRFPLKGIGGKPLLLFFRGFIGFLSLLVFFYNLAHIPIAEAMTFSKTSPIFTAIFAYIFLKENLSLKGWGAILVGFVGIVFITNPNFAELSKTDFLGILTGVGAALAYTSVRELKKYYDTRAIVLSFMLTGTIAPLILMIISEFYYVDELDFMLGVFVMPKAESWIYVLLLGLFSTLAQLAMTKAYGETKAGIVGAIGYSNILFSMSLGYFVLGEPLPTFMKFIGIFLIVLSGILVSREKI